MSATTPAALRLITVPRIVALSEADQGECLQGIGTKNLPEGTLCYVANVDMFYRLKKSALVTVSPPGGPFYNVVAGANGGGKWVATVQRAQVALTAGAGAITNMDLSGNGQFQITTKTSAGTQGFARGSKTNATTGAVTSSNNSDTSTYDVWYIEFDSVI